MCWTDESQCWFNLILNNCWIKENSGERHKNFTLLSVLVAVNSLLFNTNLQNLGFLFTYWSVKRIDHFQIFFLYFYLINHFIYLFFFSNFIVIQVQFSAFSPYLSLTPRPPHLPPVSTTLPYPPPPVIVHVSFIIVPTNPSPFSPEIPSPLPCGQCWLFLNFSVFSYILLACLFCWLGSC